MLSTLYLCTNFSPPTAVRPFQTHVQRPCSPLPPRAPVHGRLPRRKHASDRNRLHRNPERLPHVRPQQRGERQPLLVQSLGATRCARKGRGLAGVAGCGELVGRQHPRLLGGGGARVTPQQGGRGRGFGAESAPEDVVNYRSIAYHTQTKFKGPRSRPPTSRTRKSHFRGNLAPRDNFEATDRNSPSHETGNATFSGPQSPA